MSKGVAHGSADGPRMIYGRKNINWSGPKKAHNNIDIDIKGDYTLALDDFDYDLEERIEELLETHPDNAMLHRYKEPQSQEETRQSLQKIKELFSMADIDGENSRIRVNVVKPFSTQEELEGTTTFHGSQRIEDDYRTLQESLVEFGTMHLRSAKKGSNQRKRAVEMIKRIENGEVYEVLDECFDRAESLRINSFPAVGSLKQPSKPFAESIILRALATTFRRDIDAKKHYNKGTVWKREDLKKAYDEFKDKPPAINITLPDEDSVQQKAQEVIPSLIIAKNSLREPLRSKTEGIYTNLAHNIGMIQNLYGDDERLDEKLNDVIVKLIDDAENEFMYEVIVKDHARAERLAELYGMESEMDKVLDNDHDYSSVIRNGYRDEKFDYLKHFVESLRGNKRYINDTYNKELENYSEPSEQRFYKYEYNPDENVLLSEMEAIVDDLRYVYMPVQETISNKNFIKKTRLGIYEDSDIYDRAKYTHNPSRYYFSTIKDMEGYNKNHDDIIKFSESNGLKRAFSVIPKPNEYEILSFGKSATFTPKMSESYLNSARQDTMEMIENGNRVEAERRYAEFMQEAKTLSDMPFTGMKSELQKNAILRKMYNDIIVDGSYQYDLNIPEIPNYAENAQRDADRFAKEALKEMKKSQIQQQVTDINLNEIDEMF